jgi:hypothetical protein
MAKIKRNGALLLSCDALARGLGRARQSRLPFYSELRTNIAAKPFRHGFKACRIRSTIRGLTVQDLHLPNLIICLVVCWRYRPAYHRRCLRRSQPGIGIAWPSEPHEISDKDRKQPYLDPKLHGLELMRALR